MDANCVFCKIVAGDIPATKVFEDDAYIAFLDIHPVNPGHILVIPKIHYPTIIDMPAESLGPLFATVQRLMRAVKAGCAAEYVVLSVMGEEVPHVHVHIMPRFANDGLAGWWPTKEYADGEMEKVASSIRAAV